MSGPVMLRGRLIAAVTILAASPAEQERFLRNLGVTLADDLALDFDAVYAAARPVAEEVGIDSVAVAALDELDRQLQSMGGRANAKDWEMEALSTAPAWREVRRLAKAALL
jgi:hypothetical protein